MRRFATTLLLVAGIAGSVAISPARAQEQVLLDYFGFDFESPIVVPNTFGGVGNGYVGLGEVPLINPPLVADYANFQYSYRITGLTAISRLVNGDFVVVDYGGPGTLTIYEDSKTSGTPLDYGSNPPNATAPSTFIDGTPILIGTLTSFRFIYSTFSGSGSYESDFTIVGGTQLANIPVPQRAGWQFAGVTKNTLSVPDGYAHQVKGEAMIPAPTPTRSSSWGQLKRIYR
jgi:hypothetical protein